MRAWFSASDTSYTPTSGSQLILGVFLFNSTWQRNMNHYFRHIKFNNGHCSANSFTAGWNYNILIVPQLYSTFTMTQWFCCHYPKYSVINKHKTYFSLNVKWLMLQVALSATTFLFNPKPSWLLNAWYFINFRQWHSSKVLTCSCQLHHRTSYGVLTLVKAITIFFKQILNTNSTSQ